MRQICLIFLSCLLVSPVLNAADYKGKVLDQNGDPVMYATVYMLDNPIDGTATNTNGEFYLSTDLDGSALVVISFIGYEKQQIPLNLLTDARANCCPYEIYLQEQPIALEELVVETKRTRMSKRKQLAQVLRATYLKLKSDLPSRNTQYLVVSDVKMDAETYPWGMEQMIATVVELPGKGVNAKDSVQFHGDYCKRYCDPDVRIKIDTVLSHETNRDMLRMATAIDSGTVTHRALWKMRLDCSHLLDVSDELRRWKMSREDNEHCVLTYTHKYNYLGIVKATLIENLIVDAYDYTLCSYTVDLDVNLFLPFSMKMDGTMLEWINLLNMNNDSMEKFRLKRGHMHAQISNIYKEINGVLVPVEKNLHTVGQLEDRKGRVLPVEVFATQQVTDVRTKDVKPIPRYSKNARVKRVLVPVY